MPGMLSEAQVGVLRRAAGGEAAFDPLFVALMTRHHEGAIAMADEALRREGAPRLRLMAHAIRQAQRAEIELMRGIARGPEVAAAAASALLVPAGQGRAERRNDAEEHGAPGVHPGGHGDDAADRPR